jgi:hypothetical protein
MNFPSAFNKKCSCGRVFAQAGAFKNHQNTCQKSKKRLSLALAKAKEVLSSKKRHAAAAAADLHIDHENQENIPQENIPEVNSHVQVRRLPAMELPG